MINNSNINVCFTSNCSSVAIVVVLGPTGPNEAVRVATLLL